MSSPSSKADFHLLSIEEIAFLEIYINPYFGVGQLVPTSDVNMVFFCLSV